MTHAEAIATANSIAAATYRTNPAAHKEALRLAALRSFSRKDKESLSDLVRRFCK